MNLTFKELFSLPKMKKAKILAGENNLSNPIIWYHIIEIEEMSNWINSGILVFITGVGLKDTETGLLNIVTTLHKKNAAGLVINEGIYIPLVPQSVINKANELGLPLIFLPNKVKLLDITFELSHMFQEKQDILKRREHILYETLMSTPANIWTFDSVDGFSSEYDYTVCVFSYESDNYESIESATLYNILNSIHRTYDKEILSLNLHGNYVFFIPLKKAKDNISIDEQFNILMKIIYNLYDNLITLSSPLYCGIGCSVCEFSLLKTSYTQAYQAMKIAKYKILNRNILHFHDISLFRLIESCSKETLISIVNECLGELLEHKELLNTLFAYIDNDRNMKLTAKQLYIHVNSVKYRLEQIYNIIPIKLESSYDWLRLSTAMYIYKTLDI